MAHRIRVYVDTSVFGGVSDEEFADASKRFFDRVKARDCLILISSLARDEIEFAPESVREFVQGLPSESFEDIPLDEEMRTLANAYIEAGALGRASEFDALHVAAATVARADLILSWNFKHLVNYDRIRKFNAVNLLNGYPAVDIRSPKEMEHGDDDQGV